MKYENGKQTREKILEVSRELFLKEGFKDVGIRRIANKANVTSSALYKHFDSKEDILDTLLTPYVDTWWEKCNESLETVQAFLLEAKTKEDIKKLVVMDGSEWFYSFMRKNPDIWIFIFFKSAGSKYERFVDEFIDWETNIILKVLNKIDRERKYLQKSSETEIYFIVKGFVHMIINAFDERFTDKSRLNYLNSVKNMYSKYWEKILLDIL